MSLHANFDEITYDNDRAEAQERYMLWRGETPNADIFERCNYRRFLISIYKDNLYRGEI